MNKINASPQAMLIVRLAAAQAPLHWQLFAPGEPHHEASGRWPTDDASPFPALAEQYPAWVLIPASDCAFHSLNLPAGLGKPPHTGREHVGTPVSVPNFVCRLPLEKKKNLNH
ncbi:hypothetical protein ACHWGW_02860, partial [Klebsiella pneumoniae]